MNMTTKFWLMLVVVDWFFGTLSSQANVLTLRVTTGQQLNRKISFTQDQFLQFYKCLCAENAGVCTAYVAFGKVYNTKTDELEPGEQRSKSYSHRFACRAGRYGHYLLCKRLTETNCSRYTHCAAYQLVRSTFQCEHQSVGVAWSRHQSMRGRYDQNMLAVYPCRECSADVITTVGTTAAAAATTAVGSDIEVTTSSFFTPSSNSSQNQTRLGRQSVVPKDGDEDDKVVAVVVAVVVVAGVVVPGCGILALRIRRRGQTNAVGETCNLSGFCWWWSPLSSPGRRDKSSQSSHNSTSSLPTSDNARMVYSNIIEETIYSNTIEETIEETIYSEISGRTHYTQECVDVKKSNNSNIVNGSCRDFPAAQNGLTLDSRDSNNLPQVKTFSSNSGVSCYSNYSGRSINNSAVRKTPELSNDVAECSTDQLMYMSSPSDSDYGLCYEEIMTDDDIYTEAGEVTGTDYVNYTGVSRTTCSANVSKITGHDGDYADPCYSEVDRGTCDNDVKLGHASQSDTGQTNNLNSAINKIMTPDNDSSYARLHHVVRHRTNPYNSLTQLSMAGDKTSLIPLTSSNQMIPSTSCLGPQLQGTSTTAGQWQHSDPIINLPSIVTQNQIKVLADAVNLTEVENVYFELENGSDMPGPAHDIIVRGHARTSS